MKFHTEGIWEQKYITAASTNEIIADGKRIALILQYDDNGNRVADYPAHVFKPTPSLFKVA